MKNWYRSLNKKYFYFGLFSGFFGALLAIVLLAGYLLNKNMSALNTGSMVLPELPLQGIPAVDLAGQTFDFATLQGKPVVLDFWATWCSPCVAEHPAYDVLVKKYGKKVHFVSLSDEKIEKIEAYKNKNDYSFAYLKSQKEFDAFGLNLRPVMYVYDASGNLIHRQVGLVDEKTLLEVLGSAIAPH